MTFPTTPISTLHLGSATDDPSLAREDIKTAIEHINTIVAEANQPNGVAVLNGSGQLSPTQIPSTLSPNFLTINPDSRIVRIQDILRLSSVPKSVLIGLEEVVELFPGDLALCNNADGIGVPAICIWDGTNWKYSPLASLTTLTL